VSIQLTQMMPLFHHQVTLRGPAGTSCLYHARYVSCAALITIQAAERRLTERYPAVSPSGEHDLTHGIARSASCRFSQPPLVTVKLPSMASLFSNRISPARPWVCRQGLVTP
jgi:hypothetical protein